IDCPEYADAPSREARVYLRPHELELSAPGDVANRWGPYLPASVLRVSRVGAVARVACRPHGSEHELHVDIPSELARNLQLDVGSPVAITPRRARVFLPGPEYVI
ncbi:MAG: TOBE-like domain-containing protein, partial [Planctomycetia bacterium]